MKLMIEPEDGVTPLLNGINGAKKSIEIAIFRFDHGEIKHALGKAVDRGVSVHALIANTHRGNEKDLRELEMDLLPAGVEVSRTADHLIRHHYKFMVVDHRVLYLLTFNFTYLDIDSSRSFGIVTEHRDLVREASKLFQADIRRQPFVPGVRNLIVSPINARHELSRFIKGAEKQLLIYTPEISDRPMINLLRERARDGVEIRIIGRASKVPAELDASRIMPERFHTRTIIRDKREAFLGSQSLREAELDRRRELGLVLDDRSVVSSLLGVFERDWATAQEAIRTPTFAKKTAKELVRQLPLAPIVESALKHLAEFPDIRLDGTEFGHKVSDAFKEAVDEAVSGIVRNARTA
jgi:cardiolipin synthase